VRDLFLILHFVGLGVGVGASVTMFIIAIATRNLPPAERGRIMGAIGVLRHVGPIGLLILIVSGILLTLPGWPALQSNGLFLAKLLLVLVLVGWVGYGHMRVASARRRGVPPSPPPLALLPLPLVVVLAVIVLAVLVFH